MICEWWDNPSGARENIFTGVTNDYLEAIEKYTKDTHYYNAVLFQSAIHVKKCTV